MEGIDRDTASVVLADDQVATRAGIRRAIEPCGFRVVAEAGDAAQAVSAAVQMCPDVCVVSRALPGDGIEAARRITHAVPDTRIVILTATESREELFQALTAGADGYLSFTISPARLPHALAGVLNGEAALPRAMTSDLVRAFRERGRGRRPTVSVDGRVVELTDREYEVAQRLRARERTAEIALALGISDVTVRRHVSSLLRRIGASDRRALVAMLQPAGYS